MSLAPRPDRQCENLIMRAASLAGCLAAIGMLMWAAPGHAHEEEQVRVVFEHGITNIPGKSLVALVVSYAPGAKSSPHRHARSAFVYAHVLSGAIRSQVDDAPARVYRVGEGFHEVPGSHHRISENASDREPASLLAVFVVDTSDAPVTFPDRK